MWSTEWTGEKKWTGERKEKRLADLSKITLQSQSSSYVHLINNRNLHRWPKYEVCARDPRKGFEHIIQCVIYIMRIIYWCWYFFKVFEFYIVTHTQLYTYNHKFHLLLIQITHHVIIEEMNSMTKTWGTCSSALNAVKLSNTESSVPSLIMHNSLTSSEADS